MIRTVSITTNRSVQDRANVVIGGLSIRNYSEIELGFLTFLDNRGFRFYLPAIMIDIIDDEQTSDLAETLFYKFSVTHDGRLMDQRYVDVFNRSQRAAVVRFLKYLCYNRNWQLTGPAGKLLYRLTLIGTHRTSKGLDSVS